MIKQYFSLLFILLSFLSVAKNKVTINKSFISLISENKNSSNQIQKKQDLFDIKKDSIYSLNKFINKQKAENAKEIETLIIAHKEIVLATKRQGELLLLLAGLLFIILLFSFRYHLKKGQVKLQVELENAKKIIASKRLFLQNLSHEIKTPITIIIGYLSLMKQNSYNQEKLISYINLTIDNSKKITKSLDNYLALKNLKNNTPLTYSSKELGLFLYNSVNAFNKTAEIKKIKIYYKTNIQKNTKFNFTYNPILLILNNLLSNAIKYSASNSTIYVQTKIDKNTLLISVKDEGIGMSEKEKNIIFTNFKETAEYKISDSFTMSLLLVKYLVAQLKGTIDIKITENTESVFNVRIPLKLENNQLFIDTNKKDFTQINSEDHAQENTAENAVNLPKALVIDDNLEMIKYLKELLSTKLNCTFCFNGAEALEKVKEEKFSLIISDFKMPFLNGLNFKKELVKIKEYSEVPFLLITATPYEKILQKGFHIGITDYISKPFDNNEIIARIQNILENKKHQLKSLNKEEPIEIKGHFSELINKVHQTVLDNLKNPDFNVKDLALECSYSPKQLGRILQAKTGLSPVKIILEIRLLKAYELLSNKKYVTLGEVIAEVGLTNRTYFSKKFYDRFGVKPIKLLKA